MARLLPDVMNREVPGRWGQFDGLVTRWEVALGRPAPDPLRVGPRGGTAIAPAFVEWLMGLPKGWVTGVTEVGLSAQTSCLGNGVVPQQAYEAFKFLTDPDYC